MSHMAKDAVKDALEMNLSSAELQRYSRQINLSQVGKEGQRRLKEARVLCIGAGGLGFAGSALSRRRRHRNSRNRGSGHG